MFKGDKWGQGKMNEIVGHEFLTFGLRIIGKNSPWHKDFFKRGGLKRICEFHNLYDNHRCDNISR
jgi:hypothetical protein